MKIKKQLIDFERKGNKKSGLLRPLALSFCMLTFIGASAQTGRVNITMKNASVKELFQAIEKQTSYRFSYRDAEIQGKKGVTINANNEELKSVLSRELAKYGLTYQVSGNKIIVTPVQQQKGEKKQMTGKVVDAKGEPVIGATIMEKGTTNGTITDFDGNFALSVSEGAPIEISYIGYQTQQLLAKTDKPMDVTLKEDTEVLDEVVVVGYGVQKKINLTGAVSTIKSDALEKQPIVTMKDALAGLAPGLTVVKSSGQPGSSNPSITVRGVGTWQNAGPLVLVDGMSMSIADVMPNDIESISVLKDAASSAIYGSRAANGVILITTKKGKEGKIQINYNGNVGWQQATRHPHSAKGWQYAELYNRAMLADGKALPDGTTLMFPQDKIDRMKNGTGDIDKNEANTDWYDELLHTAPQQTHDLSITGGSERIQYVGTVGWAKQEGIIESTYERYNTRLNTTAHLSDWLSVQSNIAYINDVTKESPGLAGAYYYAPRAFPYMPVKYSDGTWSFHSTPKNPVRMTTSDYGYQRYETDKLSLMISPELKLFKNSLLIKGVLGYETKTSYVDRFDKRVVYDKFEPAGQEENIFIARNSKTDTWYRNRNLTLSATANYIKKIGNHDINVLLGTSREQFRYNYTSASRKDFPNDDFQVIDPGDASTATASGNKTYSALVSVFGRINYSYKDKYLFEANVRRDGSSKFAHGHRWGTFPSFSAAWRISEESFFMPLHNLIQNLKLRASWGKLGNQGIDDYLSMSTYNVVDSSTRYYLFNGVSQTLMSENVMGNSLITWETSTNLNLGFDVNMFNNRLGFSFDWYNRDTDDILLNLETPSLLGITPPISNAGKVRNRGWEFTISWQDQVNDDFSYNISFMLSDVKNKILDLKGYKSPTSNLTTRIEGEPIDALFGWETLGIADTQEKYEQYKDVMQTYNPNFSMGDIVIKDLDGDKQITEADKTIIGNQIPRYTFSLNLGLNYKAIDFYAMFQGVGKVDGFLGRDVIEPLGSQAAMEEHYYESFDPSNPTTGKYYPRMTLASRLNYANMSHWVQDASYLRLKNLQLGYTFKFNKNFPIEKVRLYLSGSNLFTLTKYRVFDPENGLNSTSYPNVKVYSIGVNVVF